MGNTGGLEKEQFNMGWEAETKTATGEVVFSIHVPGIEDCVSKDSVFLDANSCRVSQALNYYY